MPSWLSAAFCEALNLVHLHWPCRGRLRAPLAAVCTFWGAQLGFFLGGEPPVGCRAAANPPFWGWGCAKSRVTGAGRWRQGAPKPPHPPGLGFCCCTRVVPRLLPSRTSGRPVRLGNRAETLRALLVSSCAEIIVNGFRKRGEILLSLKAA